MIDISEPTFTLIANPNIRVGYCAIVEDDQMVYAGPIRRCPKVTAGMEVFLHPKDCRTLELHMEKQLN